MLKQIYVVVSAAKTKGNNAAQVSILAQVVLLVIAIAVIVLGCFPNLLVGPVQASLAPMAH